MNSMTRLTTQDRILDSVDHLLGRIGYSKMTMEDVAVDAGLGRRTIYVHFPGKEELALASIDRVVQRTIDGLRDIAGSDLPAPARLETMLVRRVVTRVEAVQGYYQSLDEVFRSLRLRFLEQRRRQFSAEAALIGRVLLDGRAKDELDFSGSPRQVAWTLILSTNSLLPYALSPKELGSIREVEIEARRLASILRRGLEQRHIVKKGGRK
jgi:hypothetical protein